MKVFNQTQQGFVLPMTLIVLALLTVLSMGLSHMARNTLNEVQSRKVMVENELLFRSSVQWSLYHLLTGVPDKRVVQHGSFSLPIDGTSMHWGAVDVRVQDAAGLLGLWYYRQPVFEGVLKQLTGETQAQEIAARLGDWIDTDQRSRYSGMEASDYVKAKQMMLPRNAALRSLDELLEIPGITPALFNGHDGIVGLRDLLLAGGEDHFNLATASSILVGPVLGISGSVLQQVLSLRQRGMWQALRLMVGNNPLFDGGSPFMPGFQYRITTTTPNGFSGRAIYRLLPNRAVPYELILWHYPDYERG